MLSAYITQYSQLNKCCKGYFMKSFSLSYPSIQELDKNTIKYLLLKSTYDHRKKKQLTYSRNVGSTIFVYNGEPFIPSPAASLELESKNGHSERMSLREAINTAIEKGWEPFKGLSKITTPFFSIKNIKDDEKLKAALQKLEAIHIFTERKPCDYRQFGDPDDPEDKGCVSYLEELKHELNFNNEKIKVYSHFSENVSKEKATYALKEEFRNLDFFFDLHKLLPKLNNIPKQIDDYLENKDLISSKKDASILNALEKEIEIMQNEKSSLNHHLNLYNEQCQTIKIKSPKNAFDKLFIGIFEKYKKILTISEDIDEKINKQRETILSLKQAGIFTLGELIPGQEKFEEKINELHLRLKETRQKINVLEKLLLNETPPETNSIADFFKLPLNEAHPLAEFIAEIDKDFFEDKITELEDSIQNISNELNDLKDPNVLDELNELKELLDELNRPDEPDAPNNQKQHPPISNQNIIAIINKEKFAQENQLNELKQQIKIHYDIKYLNLIADKIQEKINELEKFSDEESSLADVLVLKKFLLKTEKEISLMDNLLAQNKKELPLHDSNEESILFIKLKIDLLVKTSSKLAKQMFYERVEKLSLKHDEVQQQIEGFLKPAGNIYPSLMDLIKNIERMKIKEESLKAVLAQYEIELELSDSDELVMSNIQQKIINQTQVLVTLERKNAFYIKINDFELRTNETQQQILKFSPNNLSLPPLSILKKDIKQIQKELAAFSEFCEGRLNLSANNKAVLLNIKKEIDEQIKAIPNLEQQEKFYAKQSVSSNLAKDLRKNQQLLIEKSSDPIDLSSIAKKQPEFLLWKKIASPSIKQSAPPEKPPHKKPKKSP